MIGQIEYNARLKRSVAFILACTMLYMLIFGGVDLRLFKFGEEEVEHIAIIEQGEDYVIYKNSDGSNTLEIRMTTPEAESFISVDNGIYDYKSSDDTSDIYLNSDFKSGEPSILIERADFKIEMSPIIAASVTSKTGQCDTERSIGRVG